MERGVIKSTDRHTMRRMQTAILGEGSVIKALVELITNSDDSYTRLEENISTEGVIEVNSMKVGHCGQFAVRDYAEGMSIEVVRESFSKYGSATSGMKVGKRVRGYFGQGAKDALINMIDGRIYTFKDNNFISCRIFIENMKPYYEITEPVIADAQLRKLHKIPGDGTVVCFKADPHKTGPVPRLRTVQESLANNFLLRKIMTNPNRKLMLVDENREKTRNLRYKKPIGIKILEDEFSISYDKYGNFPIRISIWRADKDLTQVGDDRDGGLLLIDDKGVVLGISLFRYDNEPLAAKFFGEVQIGRFRELLHAEEPVLREERDGIVPKHPFCAKLISEIENILEDKVQAEKLRKQREAKSKLDREETAKYKEAFSILNNIAEIEAQEVEYFGQESTEQLEEPPNGFCLYPPSATITVGKRSVFELRVNTSVVHPGSVVNVTCTSSKIRVLTPSITISQDNGTNILSKYITLEGIEPNVEGTLRASTTDRLSEARIFVIPEKELLLSEGMVFQHESLTLRPNQPRKTYLLVYIKMIEGGSRIRISSDNDAIKFSEDEIIVNEFDATKHIAKYEIEVWGEGVGQDALITAEHDPYMAILEVRVRSKKDREDKGKKGMFSEPDFNFDLEPLQRTSYSAENGKIIIYVNFPSTKHYLGDNRQYGKTLPAQVLIADLVAERCFYEIAKRKIDYSGALIRPEGRLDAIQSKAHALSEKYGKKVHETLVNQKLVEDIKSSVH